VPFEGNVFILRILVSTFLVIALSTTTLALVMQKKQISIEGTEVYGPYSPGVEVNGMVWLAGQISPEGDILEQTEGALKKIDALLSAANLSNENIVMVTVLLDDINDFQQMNEAYSKYFSNCDIRPARAAFEAGALPANAKIEIVVQAVR